MRLFSEKVTPTFTSSNQNILTIKDYTEIFFDVFELEINGNKYIAEKVSEYKGNPVVNIPVVIEGKELEAPFVIQRGKFEVIFNESNSTFIGTSSKPEEVIEEFRSEAEEVEEIIFEKKESILKEIKQARKLAGEFAESVKKQNLQEVAEAKYKEREVFFKSKEKFKKDLLDEFLQLTENTRDELFTYTEQESEKAYNFVVESVNSLSDKLAQDLESTIQDQNTQSIELFENRISELAKNILTNNLLKEIESRDTTTNKNLDVKFETVSKSLTKVLGDWEANVTESVQGVVSKLDSTILNLEQANVELNDSITRNANKALSRIGNVKTQLEESIANTTSTLTTKLDTTDASVRVIEGIVSTVDTSVSKIQSDVEDTLNVVNESIVSTESKINDIQANVQHTLSNVNDSIVTVESKIDDLSVDTQSKIGLLEDNISIFQNSSTIVEKTINDFKSSTLTLQQNVDTLRVAVDNTVKKLTSNVENKITINNTTLKESLDNTVRELTSDLENKITIAEGKITSYYDDRITLIKSSVTDITAKDKAHIIELIEESKKTILDEVALIKNSVPSIVVEKTLETKGDVNVKSIKTDLEKSISNRFNLELANVRRIIELSSGGGSVAVQFANGGIMRGNLNVTGQILSAGVDLATIFSGGGGGGDAAVNTLVHSSSANWNSAYNIATAYQVASSAFTTQINGTTNQINVTSIGSTYKISLPQSIVTPGDLNVLGSLVISGSSLQVAASSMSVNDPLIYLANGNIGNAVDIGFIGHFNNGLYQHTGLARKAVDGIWTLFSGVTSEPLDTNLVSTTDPTFRIDSLRANIIGNVTGNALTVTNGILSTGSYSNPSWITGLDSSKVTGTNATNWNTSYNELSSRPYTLVDATSSIQPIRGFNTASGCYSTIAGGLSNTASGYGAIITGGSCNTANGPYNPFIGSGSNNTASGYCGAFIGAGSFNTASGYFGSSVIGGAYNTASVSGSIIAGGICNTASGYYSNVVGGICNTASGCMSNVAGGKNNTASGIYSSITGGAYNTASGAYANISGKNNTVSGNCSTASGYYNMVSGTYSSVVGGSYNTASGYFSTVINGYCSIASGAHTTASGYYNTASNTSSVVINGYCNTASAIYSTILNGCNNCICSTAINSSIIAGGGITALSANTAYAPTLALTNVPTSSVGLGSGFIWRSTVTNQLFIVP